MIARSEFSPDTLHIDCAAETEKIVTSIRHIVSRVLNRQGIVVGLSGGIDSSVVGALCVRALGKERVLGLLMPERESSPETSRLSELVAGTLGIPRIHEDITKTLEAVGCYRHRDEAIQALIPAYTPDCLCKIVLPTITEKETYRLFSVIVEFPDGHRINQRLTPQTYLALVAATNFKQRVRKMFEYYHADRLNYAVAGTPNRQEYDQGFFVKLGDGTADIKPIAHLYKTQVYLMAEFLGIPEEICCRPPTTDTYPMEQSQEEFYFSVPHDKFDLCLYGKNRGIAPEDVAQATGYSRALIERIYRDIDHKRRTTRYLHLPPILIESIPEIKST